MPVRKSLTGLTLSGALFLSLDASAAGYCSFHASDSVFYFSSYVSSRIYAYGPISFSWEPDTGRILSGYYTERVVYYTPVITYFNNVSSGTISTPVDQNLNLNLSIGFTRTVPNTYSAPMSGTLTGTHSSATLRGYVDGPFLLEATGIVTCSP